MTTITAAIERKRKVLRKLLDNVGKNKVLTVTFVKANGETREITFSQKLTEENQKGLKHGDPSHVFGADQRLALHPELYPVYSILDKGFRQINLDTVQRVTASDAILYET